MLSKAELAGMTRAVAEFVQRQIKSALNPVFERLSAVEARQPERGEKGDRGEAGERGVHGAPGERGEKGDAGERGADGAPGRDGERGEPGQNGAPGERGEPGRDGNDGRDGAPGVCGERGEKGDPGAPGKLPIVRAWTDAVHYEGDVVAFEGRTFQALKDTGKTPGHGDWICIAERGADGRDGADAKSIGIRGTWAEGETYQALDVVALNGASFVAKHDDPGPCPGDGWQLWAAQGKRGRQGDTGQKGDRGERGPAGAPVVSLDVDDEGLLTLTNGDGTQIVCDLYPVLSKLRA